MEKKLAKLTKPELIQEVLQLHKLINEQGAELDRLKSEAAHVQKLKNELQYKMSEAYWAPAKNERGAGRKSKTTDAAIAAVKNYRDAGMSYKVIAEAMGISVGLAHKCGQTVHKLNNE